MATVRNIKSMAELQAEKKQALRLRSHDLPTDKLLVGYGRQSTSAQVRDNTESYSMQSDDLLYYGLEKGWTQEKIILVYENELDKFGRKSGKARSASGAKRIDQRPGMQEVMRLIASGEVGCIIVFDVSRLYRDRNMTQATAFADLCQKHGVFVLTTENDSVYNFALDEDYKRFLSEAQAAADYLTKQIAKMIRAKERKALRGEYTGNVVPVGFHRVVTIDEHGKKVKSREVYPPHAEDVPAIFKRFRMLNGSLHKLGREVYNTAVFCEVDEGVTPPRLKHVTGGFTFSGDASLRVFLCNPIYIGMTYYKGELIKSDGPVLVEMDDFLFAFNRLNGKDLQGNEIIKPKRVARYQQKASVPTTALLEGVRPNGLPMITGVGLPCYVFAAHGNDSFYRIMNPKKGIAASSEQVLGNILCRDLDALFAERLLYRVESSNVKKWKIAIHDGDQSIKLAITRTDEVIDGWYKHFQEIAKQAETALTGVDDSIEQGKREIARITRRLDVAQDTMSDVDLRLNYAKLASLRSQLSEFEKAKKARHIPDSELQDAAEKVASLPDSWGKMDMIQKRRLISLITKSITLEKIANGWLRLTIQWTDYFAWQVTDVLYMNRARGKNAAWSTSENEVLQAGYATASRMALLESLPDRTWVSCKEQARALGVKRPYSREGNALNLNVSMNDKRIMDRYGLVLDAPDTRHWWQSASTINRVSAC